MDIIDDDGYATLRLHQIERFPNVKLSHDDIHSNCSICISNFTKGEIILILPCVHKFHRCCIQPWLSENSTCPTCRETVIEGIGDESNDDENSDEDVEFGDDSDDSLIEISAIARTTNSYSAIDFALTDTSSDDNLENSDFSWQASVVTDANDTVEMDSESGDDSITVSASESESDNINESHSSSSSGERSDGTDAMFPTADTSDADSLDTWEMSGDSSD